MEQFSLVTSIGGGAGALSYGHGVNMPANMLGLDPALTGHGQNILVNRTHVGNNIKRRFGSTNKTGGDEYKYPHHPVKDGGNGQAYPLSKAGYLPGNGAGGLAGYGVTRHDAHFNPAADLTEAMAIAHRAADQLPHFVKEEHYRYQDRTKLEIQERMELQAMDYQRLKIKDLMAKGFSEEEIARKLEKERESAIDKATRLPVNQTALLEATLARKLPTQMNEDFAGTSVAPGGISLRKDMSAIERATGQGNPVAQRKAFQALRHRERLREKVPHRVEPAVAKEPKVHAHVIQMLLKNVTSQHHVDATHDIKKEQLHREHQLVRQTIEREQQDAMRRAMGESKMNHYRE